MSQPPSELSQSGHWVLTGVIQVNSGAHHPVRRIWKSSSREWRILTRTRVSFPLHREWHQQCSSQTGLLSRKQMWLFLQGESWSELFSVTSLTCFPVRRSKCSWFSPAGMEGGSTLETRYHLSLEHQGAQTPHHLLHLKPKSYRPGESGPMKIYPVSFKPHLGLSRMPGWVNWKVCQKVK